MGLCRRAQREPVVGVTLARKLFVQAMNGITQTRISWHRLVTIVLALMVMTAPVSASLCATGDGSAQSSKLEARCSGMAVPLDARVIRAESRVDCCHISLGL